MSINYAKMCEVLKCGKPSKKITIKNKTSRFEGCITESEIQKLETAVVLIHKSLSLNATYEDLYRIVENLCTHNMKEKLYYNLYETVENHLNVQLVLLNSNAEFLHALNQLWTGFCDRTKLINNIYMHLDRVIINDKAFKNSIWAMNLSLFKNNIVMRNDVKEKLIEELLTVISNERKYNSVDLGLIRTLVRMLADLNIYEELFEPSFLSATNDLYRDESQELVMVVDIVDYINYADKRICEEESRVRNYLLPRTETLVMSIVNTRLLADHLQKVLHDSINKLIDENRLDVLRLLYTLLKKIPNGFSQLEKHFGDYIVKRGLSVVQDTEKDKSMIQFLLDFKDQVDNVVNTGFEQNLQLLEVVKKSFKYFVNQRHNKPAELLAKFLDGVLKSKNLQDTEETLDKIMVIFRFVQGKDIFEAFYKKDLCKRLLVGKSSSHDAEYSMINKLKLECGSCFTAKLEGMFKDVRLSYDINTSFKQHLLAANGKSSFNFDMNINVLTNSYWPTFACDSVNLPEQMIQFQLAFQKFYLNTYNGRKLQWQPNLGSCILKAYFDSGLKELQVSLFQTVVLLLFNATDKISYKDIEEGSNIKTLELKRTLQSLACGKARVLHKVPKGKEVEDSDEFVLKRDFTDKLFRVKINQIQMKETVEEQKATEESVFHDRQFQIDAAIVRIMKQKKLLNHNELISELYKTFDLPIKAVDFKKRIEQLIEREYIERDKENGNLYKYIA